MDEPGRIILSVALVFALLGLLLLILRRGLRDGLIRMVRPNWSTANLLRKNRVLDSIERIVLTPQHSVLVIRFGDRELVVAAHPQGCSVLAEKTNSETCPNRA